MYFRVHKFQKKCTLIDNTLLNSEHTPDYQNLNYIHTCPDNSGRKQRQEKFLKKIIPELC